MRSLRRGRAVPPIEQNDRRGARQDVEVEQQRPTCQVVEIVFELAPGVVDRVAGWLVELNPAGHAGPDTMTVIVGGDSLAPQAEEPRAFRAWSHERHVTDEHVPCLRDLVDA